MTDILLSVIIVELGVVMWALLRSSKSVIQPAPKPTTAPQTFDNIAVYDADGQLRFCRPSGHPDLTEIQRHYKDNRYAGWKMEGV